MPLYEYQCASCGHRFEKIQRFSDPLLDTCPSCNGREVHKLLSAPAFQFKGTGWYITDYAGKKPGATSDTSGSTSSDSKSESKSESKTETKTETKSESKAESKPETKPDGK
jgi:putative FmdB family regulatory protein